MEFRENFDNHVKSLEKFSNMNFNEEQTKMALIVPFIKMLGYDVYNPLEVIPEFICDIGEKKGEKVDYAISINGTIELLIETKPMSDLLINHDVQLTRYFNVTNAKVGILTNGVIYKFFTDLDEKNRLDSKPFLEVNMLNITDSQILELRKFHKKNFDVDVILSSDDLVALPSALQGKLNSYNALEKALDKVKNKYDYIIIDTLWQYAIKGFHGVTDTFGNHRTLIAIINTLRYQELHSLLLYRHKFFEQTDTPLSSIIINCYLYHILIIHF